MAITDYGEGIARTSGRSFFDGVYRIDNWSLTRENWEGLV